MPRHTTNEHTPFNHLRNTILLIVCILFAIYTIIWFFGPTPKTPENFSQSTISVSLENRLFILEIDKLFHIPTNTKISSTTFLGGFVSWLGFGNTDRENFLNTPYLNSQIGTWEEILQFKSASEGTISLSNKTIQVSLPETGIQINKQELARDLTQFRRHKEIKRIYNQTASTQITKPKTNTKDFQKLATNITNSLSQNFILSNNELGISHTLTIPDLFNIISVEYKDETFAHEIIINEVYLTEHLAQYSQEVQDASFVFNADKTVSIKPSQTGIEPSISETVQAFQEAIKNGENSAQLFFITTYPELTTEKADELNINHLVSSFTTYFACCEARARNIKRAADSIDGTLIAPGETFNLNTTIGKRTLERGFEPAGTLVKGSLIETVGGGISQFATTFYNTVYWGGFQIVSHTPHSRYFSRYPEGVEATISWPEPHLIFKNDTDNAILIKTSHTATSITVSFWSDNNGRMVSGTHGSNQGTKISVLAEGGTNSRVVESIVDNKTEIYPPKEIYYVDKSLEQNAIFTKTLGKSSYSIDARRIVRIGESVVSDKQWKTFYLSEDKEFLVQDCSFAPLGSICKTPEDLEQEKKDLQDFFEKLEAGG